MCNFYVIFLSYDYLLCIIQNNIKKKGWIVKLNNSGTFKSADNESNIVYYIYYPDMYDRKEPTAILQISHGMCEYFERYKDFIRFMNKNNIIVCGNDHLGHGDSKNLGFIAHENGFNYLREDLYTLNKLMKSKYPNIPYILLGHSMGSFIARYYTEKYSNSINACIYMGTAGSLPFYKPLISIIDLMIKFKGEKYRSDLIYNLAFGKYDRKIKDSKSEYAWLTRDEEVVREYEKDPKTHFIFTLSGFKDLITLLKLVNRKDWFKEFPKDLPILLISGTDDPVGDYSKGVLQVYRNMLKAGCKNVDIKLINGARHEVLNELDKEDTYKDLKDFIFKISEKMY